MNGSFLVWFIWPVRFLALVSSYSMSICVSGLIPNRPATVAIASHSEP